MVKVNGITCQNKIKGRTTTKHHFFLKNGIEMKNGFDLRTKCLRVHFHVASEKGWIDSRESFRRVSSCFALPHSTTARYGWSAHKQMIRGKHNNSIMNGICNYISVHCHWSEHCMLFSLCISLNEMHMRCTVDHK